MSLFQAGKAWDGGGGAEEIDAKNEGMRKRTCALDAGEKLVD